MLYRYILLVLLLVFAVAEDIRTYKISNAITAVGVAAGIILNLASGGLTGLVECIAAVVVPAVLLIILFALRMLGAGDIKLFCAIGAIMGLRYVLCAMAFSFLAGGLIALALMLVRGNFKLRLRHIAAYIGTCFLTGKLTAYTDFNRKDDKAKFHFSIAIAVGCMIWSALTLL